MAIKKIKISLCQTNPVMGDFAANEAGVKKAITKARKQKSTLLLFPELTLSGYPPEDLLLKPHFIDENLRSLKRISKSTGGITVVCGFVDRSLGGSIHNAAAILESGKIKSVYHKIELPNYGVFDERRYFTPGNSILIFQHRGVRFAVGICEDIWNPFGEYFRLMKSEKPDAILNCSASPYHFGKKDLREKTLSSAARLMRAPIFYSNMVGGQDELVFDGRSCVVDKKGITRFRSAGFEETVDCVSLKSRKGIGADIIIPGSNVPRSEGGVGEVLSALVMGTRDYVKKNGFSKAVIGLSGGIDSALTAAVAVKALGRKNVLCVTMPSEFTSMETFKDAVILAKNLGVDLWQIPIGSVYDAYEASLTPFFEGRKPNVAEENIQARIRGNLLMAISNKFGHLVLTTGNKSEVATGYCTLYGDMAGGLAVIKDVPKTLVYKISRFLNKAEKRELIPAATIRRAPTAELRHNQKDQDSLPPYPELDKILEAYVESDCSEDEIVRQGFKRATVRDAIRRVDFNEYKRRQGPPGIKITPKNFGRDRRIPITNRFRG